MNGYEWQCVISGLSEESAIDVSIKKELSDNQEKYRIISAAIEAYGGKSTEKQDNQNATLAAEVPEEVRELKTILDKIYYAENGASLNSKKLYMIRKVFELYDDRESAIDFVLGNYRFDLREVDAKKKKNSQIEKNGVPSPGNEEDLSVIERSVIHVVEEESPTNHISEKSGIYPENLFVSYPAYKNEMDVLKTILDEIYYAENGVSLNSKKLYMIRLVFEIYQDREFAKKIVQENYNFDLREVDVKRRQR